ncbi:MAG: hypothetical protein A3J63_01850 [Candidatus Moranbacteria bacterium RIFCSPHIGHO2_02_FULL_40_12b]|nr:MAG: hypothetical protein A3J63_01850 [Candidatus Moranbacteria bacterium RIFCSPHIGHO2_02_FULL_40_12b]OGI23471.1 MAG: hypothetical protein A3E91_01645 [Candidatus Moranbacteria bacterium RIFCSPHIGHO2_12_FULL_40_10]
MKLSENPTILFWFFAFVFGFLGFSASVFAAGTVSFTADTIVSLSGISDGDLYVANTSQAGSMSISGAALTVSAIPDGDSFILKTINHTNALKLTPSGGAADLEFDSSHLSAGEITEWTLTATGSVQAAHIVGVPSASTWYAINIGGSLYNKYQSNSSSEVSFTYSGGWSSKVFTIEETTAPLSNDNSVELDEDEDDNPDNLDISKAGYTAYSNKILIQWKTNRDANSHLEWGKTGDLGDEEYDSRKVENHRITLDNLESDTLYYFRMKSTDEYGNDDRTKVYSAKTKSAINWGLNASGFFPI